MGAWGRSPQRGSRWQSPVRGSGVKSPLKLSALSILRVQIKAQMWPITNEHGMRGVLGNSPPRPCLGSALLTLYAFVVSIVTVHSLAYLKNHIFKLHQIFCTCYSWLWPGIFLTIIQYGLCQLGLRPVLWMTSLT